MKLSTAQFRIGASAILTASVLSLAGCTNQELATDTKFTPSSGSEQYPIRSTHGLITLNVANQSGSLQASQVNAVADFARDAALSGASVSISRPSGSSPRLASEIANLMAQQGVSSHAIHLAAYAGSAGGPVRISYRAARASVRKCGDWSEDVTDTKFNEPMPNLGCAVQTNIAAMVSNPDDFNHPEPTDPALASVRVPSITALQDPNSLASVSKSAASSAGGSGSGGSGGSGGGGKAP